MQSDGVDVILILFVSFLPSFHTIIELVKENGAFSKH